MKILYCFLFEIVLISQCFGYIVPYYLTIINNTAIDLVIPGGINYYGDKEQSKECATYNNYPDMMVKAKSSSQPLKFESSGWTCGQYNSPTPGNSFKFKIKPKTEYYGGGKEFDVELFTPKRSGKFNFAEPFLESDKLNGVKETLLIKWITPDQGFGNVTFTQEAQPIDARGGGKNPNEFIEDLRSKGQL